MKFLMIPSTFLFSRPWLSRKIFCEIFVSLLYMGEKFFYAPRTFGFSCPWLSGKSFLREFSGIPSQMRCNFPI